MRPSVVIRTRNELETLVAGLHAAARPKARARSKKTARANGAQKGAEAPAHDETEALAKPQPGKRIVSSPLAWILASWGAVTVFSVTLWVWPKPASALTESAAVAESAAPSAPALSGPYYQAECVGKSLAPEQIPVLCSRLRPAGMVEGLQVDGRPANFVPVEKLAAPEKDRPLALRVLLRAQLDQHTERSWKLAGLLANEAVIANPFLRTVTITDQAGVEYLSDWHVEAVAVK